MRFQSLSSVLAMMMLFARPLFGYVAPLPVVCGQATYYDAAGPHTYDLTAQELSALTDGDPATGVHLDAWPYWINGGYQLLPQEVHVGFDAGMLMLDSKGTPVADLVIAARACTVITVPSVPEDHPGWHYARVEVLNVDLNYDEGLFSWNTLKSLSTDYTWSRGTSGLIPFHVDQSGVLTLSLGSGATVTGPDNRSSFDAYELSITGELVPEPSSVLAILCGVGGLVWRRRK